MAQQLPMESIRYLTITELGQMLNHSLEQSFPRVAFEGEVSDARRVQSGHTYLTIKDSKSQLAAVIWRSTGDTLTFKLEPGLKVVCEGRPNLWHVSGKLQIVIQKISPAGEGALRKKFLELKEKLEREGLFNAERKRPLPFLPRAVGVVTSSQGAVIHDIMVRMKARMPQVPVYLVDVRVQGPGSAEEIAEGIRYLGESNLVDVIIVGRGGGSLEDLWSFNEEIVCRAIFASRIPVVSAVGHESDVSLSDLVADLRAPTPTAAAEMVVPKREDLLRAIDDLERRLGDVTRWLAPLTQSVDELSLRMEATVLRSVERAKLTVATAEARLRGIEPTRIVDAMRGRVRLAEERLRGGVAASFAATSARFEGLRGRYLQALPVARVERARDRLTSYGERLSRGSLHALQRMRTDLDRRDTWLQGMNPGRILERGYSLVQKGGVFVRRSTDLAPGDSLTVRFAEGGAEVSVDTILER